MKLSSKISALIDALKVLPGIGPKSAKRMALSLLSSNKDTALSLSKSIEEAVLNIKFCSKCFVLNDQEICEICRSPERRNDSICVVESTSDLYSIEETSEFKGKYFVLNGLLSPIDNIGAEELNIGSLLELIGEYDSKEIIIALNSTLEGEATSYFLLEKLKKENIVISRIAQGVPSGGDLNYVDNNTLRKALSFRTELK
ncbi:MAG: recombination protein RecR [Gammaproteobacteria bacterium]|jgi:recombination protein RecR|nr:MAG: recombination protein RecR [Gammaproteobacteria bacterium]|tara:strand:+ start:89 stop:688 length:600 start_codon:yes stop_codon:yes gene_type:complete